LASIVTAMTATVALLLTVFIWKDQQSFNSEQITFNRDQQAINAENNAAERLRREAVYASRVSFWVQDTSYKRYEVPSSTLKIQNRSPAPLTRVAVICSKGAGRPFAYADPGLIPPCSLVTLRPRFFEIFSIDLLDRLNRSRRVGVAFFDANQRAWQRDLNGKLIILGGTEFGEDGPFQSPRLGISGEWISDGSISISSTPDCNEAPV
jgi:hypothetical protein